MNSSQDEVSELDEWARIHYAGLPWDDYDRMVALSQANRLRLQNAVVSLNERRQQAEP